MAVMKSLTVSSHLYMLSTAQKQLQTRSTFVAPSTSKHFVATGLLDANDSGAPSLAGALLALTLAQQLLPPPPRLVLLTRGALTSSSAAHGGAWGIARVARLEHAALRLQSVDTRRSASSAEAAALLKLGARPSWAIVQSNACVVVDSW